MYVGRTRALMLAFAILTLLPSAAQADFSKDGGLAYLQQALGRMNHRDLAIKIEDRAVDDSPSERTIRGRIDDVLQKSGIVTHDLSRRDEHFLYVSLSTVGVATNIRVEFHRKANWVAPRGRVEGRHVTTWERSSLCVNYPSARLLEALDSVVEQFVSAYLTANE